MNPTIQAFCQLKFESYDQVERLKLEQAAFKKQKEALHHAMVAEMQGAPVSKLQVSPTGDVDGSGDTLQVSLQKYYTSESVLKEEVLRKAGIDWAELFNAQRPLEERVDHAFLAIQKARKTSKPLVKVDQCGSTNRGKLGYVDPAKPLQRLVVEYAQLTARLRGIKERLHTLEQTDEMKRCEKAALEHLDGIRSKQKLFTIKGAEWAVKKSELTRTKPPTVGQLRQCIAEACTAPGVDRATFFAHLIRLLRAANEPTIVTTVSFVRKVPKAIARPAGAAGAGGAAGAAGAAGAGGAGRVDTGPARRSSSSSSPPSPSSSASFSSASSGSSSSAAASYSGSASAYRARTSPSSSSSSSSSAGRATDPSDGKRARR